MLLPLPCVCQMMPPLRAPEEILPGLDSEILMHARNFFITAIEQHEIVHQLNQPLLIAHLEQIFIQLEPAVVGLILLPFQEILLLCADGPVFQALRIIAGENKLHGAEKPLMEFGLLVRKICRINCLPPQSIRRMRLSTSPNPMPGR